MGPVTAPRARLPAPLDLTPPGDMLTAQANAAIHETLGRIPGLTVTGVRAARASAKTTCVSIDVKGWSPTLHEAPGVLVLNLPAPAETHSVTRDEMEGAEALGRFARIQRDRAEAGIALGISAPLDPSGESVPSGRSRVIRRMMPTEVRHLLVDASLPSVLATAGEDPVGDLRDGVRRMHGSPGNLVHGGDGEGVHRDGDIWMQEVRSDALGIDLETPVTIRIVGRAAVVDAPDGMTASYDGRHLRIAGHGIPATVVAVMPGMRLGDVVDLHPALRDRTVDDAETDGTGELWISLVPDLLPLVDAVQMVADAQED